MSDRELILGRIRSALAGGSAAPGADDDAAGYARAGDLGEAQRAELFAERCAEYRATVTRCGCEPESVAWAVGEALVRHGVRTAVVPPDLPPEWLVSEVQFLHDAPPVPLESLERCDAALTACELAIALTGTIVLSTGPGQGRRALSLIPDLHVCVVRSGRIVETVPEAIDRLARPIREGHPITFISGPSATSDIELKRIEGVHGPRRLEVIVAGGED